MKQIFITPFNSSPQLVQKVAKNSAKFPKNSKINVVNTYPHVENILLFHKKTNYKTTVSIKVERSLSVW